MGNCFGSGVSCIDFTLKSAWPPRKRPRALVPED
jgi:hypothetical protein